MDNLNFYTVDQKYVKYLQNTEIEHRGFSRVPNMDYGKYRKQKFLCGIVLEINSLNYFVPVSSYKEKKADNFIICDKNNNAVSSLRFNYMFPIPLEIVKERRIDTEPDKAYKTLLAQELKYCIKNQEYIRRLAQRTYKRVIMGKSPSLLRNSCDFSLLEKKCNEYRNLSEVML